MTFLQRLKRTAERLWVKCQKQASMSYIDQDPAQWHRWHKANREHQRRLTAMKQRSGVLIHPNVTGLRRSWVR